MDESIKSPTEGTNTSDKPKTSSDSQTTDNDKKSLFDPVVRPDAVNSDTPPRTISDNYLNDWDMFESWTILGEPVMTPIIKQPSITKPLTPPPEIADVAEEKMIDEEKKSEILVTSNYVDVIVIDDDDDEMPDESAATHNTLTIPNDNSNRSDCDTPSDGISIISDCSDFGHHHHHRHSSLDTEIPPHGVTDIVENFQSMDTPPNTPVETNAAAKTNLKEKISDLTLHLSSERFPLSQSSSRTFELSAVNIILFSLLAGMTGIILGNSFRVRHEDGSILHHVTPLVHRIQHLEQENSALRHELKRYQMSDSGRSRDTDETAGPSTSINPRQLEVIFPQPLEYYLEQNINDFGKRVWTGDDEDSIVLENVKLKMPEFCTEDTSDDLMSERYSEICEKKTRKLSKIVQNQRELMDNGGRGGGSQAPSSSSADTITNTEAKQTDDINDDSNWADIDDDTSSMDKRKIEMKKPTQTHPNKKKLKRQKAVKKHDDDDDTSEEVIPRKAGIFAKRRNMNKKKASTSDETSEKDSSAKKSSKKSSDDWYEKRKAGRDELRRANSPATGSDNWYIKRATNREKQRENVEKKK